MATTWSVKSGRKEKNVTTAKAAINLVDKGDTWKKRLQAPEL